MTFRGYGCILIVACLMGLIVLPAAASVPDFSSPVPLVAVGIPNVLQEKSKLQYTAGDFQTAGENAEKSGNYADAIKYYTVSEDMILADDPGRSSKTDGILADLEGKKATAYGAWGGHEAEEKQAWAKANELQESSRKKLEVPAPGCLIVTATFGSPLASEVQLVRNFRDDTIAKSYTGSRFMPGFNAWYYSFSPQVSMYINEHPYVKPAMQVLITPILMIVLFAQNCYSFLSFNPELATIVAIIVGSALYGLIYIFPTAMAGVWVARRHGWEGGSIRSMRPFAGIWVSLIMLIIVGVTFSLDLLTTVASGLFVIATILLVVGILSMSLSRYIGSRDAAMKN